MLAILFAQAVVNVPAISPAELFGAPANPSHLSLVVADTVSETDPQKLCPQANCTSLFLGRYENARTLAGVALPTQFAARVEMGSPWNMRYRLALIVEQRPGMEPLVRAMAGFNQNTSEACFDVRETEALRWQPEAPEIVRQNAVMCVNENG
ncbi:hypothetical protein [Candidatus Viadribacter manganicus]|uniref:Uncharacterized protein n=1 Tax=Candidatus Viadribacter manganicus TaxID=1759059 RepID=A0A1B1AGY4_9PROT|nr:hypothetical protein [Candidatus Viadribacter manganicus]ANP45822.1 hypothetical protein ATE48_07735 [Candidatus Viadribacter manganicus]